MGTIIGQIMETESSEWCGSYDVCPLKRVEWNINREKKRLTKIAIRRTAA